MEIEVYYGNGEQYVDITGAALVNWYDRKKRQLVVPPFEGSRLRIINPSMTLPTGPNHIKVVTGTVIISSLAALEVPIGGHVKVLYGADTTFVDVTEKAFAQWEKTTASGRHVLDVPAEDHIRALALGDPVPGVIKHIKIVPLTEDTTIKVDEGFSGTISVNVDFGAVAEKFIAHLHTTLRMVGGKMADEYPEQIMAAKYLKPSATVLELGSNIGRNSLIISSILDDSSRFITMECDPVSAKQLRINRDINGFDFNVCNAALSLRRLAQKGWDTVALEEEEAVPEGHTEVETISYLKLRAKYGLTPDTLIADVEGALHHILTDMPEILEDINLIIVENDYKTVDKKKEVDAILTGRGFKTIYRQLGPSWMWQPCHDFFYEVWSKQ